VDVTVGARARESCVASCRPLDGCDCVQRASYECGEENPWTVAGIGPTFLTLGTTGLGEMLVYDTRRRLVGAAWSVVVVVLVEL
jgi:hypothetical protein